jgi:hydroxymethylbilane synthase
VLAACGLERIGLAGEIGFRFPIETLLPEVGQGAIALQTRVGDGGLVAAADHLDTRRAVMTERAVTRLLGGGCSTPVAAHAHRTDGGWRLIGWTGATAAAEGPEPHALVESVVRALS